jgi:peptidoglycan/LPS O-acetylase OafA/YrhL
MDHNRRIFGLDLLRFAAIVCVIIAHTLGFLSQGDIPNAIVSYSAVLGVEFFFVLSGMLIGTIIIKTHVKEKITTFSSVKVFWIRRWFRTLPNYYLMLIVYFVLALRYLPSMSGLKWASFLVFLQDATTPENNSFFGTAWSLCIEEWFYLLFPLCLILMQIFFKKKPVSLLATIIIFITMSLLGRVFLSFNNNIAWDAGYRKMLFIRLDSIAIGVLAAFVSYYFADFWIKNKNKLFVLGAILFISLLIIFYYKFILTYNNIRHENIVDVGFFMKTTFFTLIDISIALFLPFLCALKVKSSNLLGKGVTFISLISYSLYLLHPIMVTYISHFLKNRSGIIIFIGIWVASIVGAYIQYRFFEINMTSLRDRFFKKKEAITVT